MTLPGGTFDCNLPSQLHSSKCQADLTDIVLLLTTRCLYSGVCLSSDVLGTSENLKMSSWPDVVLLLITKCLYQGGTSENLNTLCVSCFASQRSFLRKTNNNHCSILPTFLWLTSQISLHWEAYTPRKTDNSSKPIVNRLHALWHPKMKPKKPEHIS